MSVGKYGRGGEGDDLGLECVDCGLFRLFVWFGFVGVCCVVGGELVDEVPCMIEEYDALGVSESECV